MNRVLFSNSDHLGDATRALFDHAVHVDGFLIGEVIGALMVLFAAFRWSRKRSIKWVPMTARVTGCRVSAVPSGIIKSRKLAHTHYDYTYEVEGTIHVSAQSVLENKELFFEARRHARNIVNQGELQIFYNARQPEISVLTVPRFHFERLMAIAGLALAILCLAMGKLQGPQTGRIPQRESAASRVSHLPGAGPTYGERVVQVSSLSLAPGLKFSSLRTGLVVKEQ